HAWGSLSAHWGSRYFYPFIIMGGLLALILMRRGLAQYWPEAKGWRYWLGRSARIDYWLLVANPLIKLVLFSGMLAWAGSLANHVSPRAEATPETAWLWAIPLTLCLFLSNDFMRWLTHWAMHRVPFMWSFHKVHHAAESMTFATAERHHFMDVVFVTVPFILTASLVNAVFILTTGIAASPIAIYGANIILVVFNAFAGAMRHGPFFVSFGERIERWLISPGMHQLHHSRRQVHYDKNFGGALAIWDRMFGTWEPATEGLDALSDGIGLGPEDDRLLDPLGVFYGPFAEVGGQVVTEIRKITEPEGPALEAARTPADQDLILRGR
ncbi:MAG: sterol desaturase family protein, partial [Pseudomonadota bacterium]